jgi:hypothetical protein
LSYPKFLKAFLKFSVLVSFAAVCQFQFPKVSASSRLRGNASPHSDLRSTETNQSQMLK